LYIYVCTLRELAGARVKSACENKTIKAEGEKLLLKSKKRSISSGGAAAASPF
jgi:hypothetical protein